MVIPHVHAHVNCDGTVIPHACVLSEMVIPHIVYDGMVIPHVIIIKKIWLKICDGTVIPHAEILLFMFIQWLCSLFLQVSPLEG